MKRTCALDSEGSEVGTQLCRVTHLPSFLGAELVLAIQILCPGKPFHPRQSKTIGHAPTMTLNDSENLGWLLCVCEPQFSQVWKQGKKTNFSGLMSRLVLYEYPVLDSAHLYRHLGQSLAYAMRSVNESVGHSQENTESNRERTLRGFEM